MAFDFFPFGWSSIAINSTSAAILRAMLLSPRTPGGSGARGERLAPEHVGHLGEAALPQDGLWCRGAEQRDLRAQRVQYSISKVWCI